MNSNDVLSAKKILIVNYEFPPLGGGAAIASYSLAKELSEKGYQIDVLTSKYKDYEIWKPGGNVNIHTVTSWRKGVHDCGYWGALSFLLFAIPKIQKLVNKYKYDLIHYFFSLPSGLLSLLPGKVSRTPYLVSLRGSDVPGYDPFEKSLQKMHWLLLPLNKRIVKKAKGITALSQSLKLKALESFNDIEISVIPNGIDKRFLNLTKSKDETGKFQLICISRLIARKGIEHILEAIFQIKDPDIVLKIVGEGKNRSKLEKIASNLKVSDQVSFSGFHDSTEIPGLLSKADVFILCPYAESFGIVFIEAMAAGLPIIGSNVGGIVEYVKKENGILVEPGDVEGIKNAICHLKKNPELICEMGKKNRRKMSEKYNWSKIAELYIQSYNR